MATSLWTLNSAVVREMKIDRNKRIWNNSDINEAINDAILEVQKSWDFNWTFNKGLTTLDTVTETITSVTNSSGIAQFNHSGTDPILWAIVALNWFDVETTYNTTGTVSVVSIGSFEVDNLVFTATDTGKFSLQEYAVPSEFQRMNLVKQNKRLLDSSSLAQLQVQGDEDRQWTPLNYYIRDNKIGFSPIPTSVLTMTLNFRQRAPELVLDTDLMVLEDDFKRAIQLYASYILLSQLDSENIQRANIKLWRYNQEIAKLNMIFRLVDEWQKFYKTSYRAPSRQAMTRRARIRSFIGN